MPWKYSDPKSIVYHRKWKKENADKVREYAKRSYRKHIETARERGRRFGERRVQLHRDAVQALGGKCVRCEITDIRVLGLNHINGDGWKDRKEKKTDQIYREVVAGTRSDLEVRCFNCNRIHAFERKLFAINKKPRITESTPEKALNEIHIT